MGKLVSTTFRAIRGYLKLESTLITGPRPSGSPDIGMRVNLNIYVMPMVDAMAISISWINCKVRVATLET